jgi:hypothetical protein
MPGALAVNPRDGRVFVASLKMGELFVLDDPSGDGQGARFVDYTRGLFQDALAMHHDGEAHYVCPEERGASIVSAAPPGV